jgi:hypothetical protein
MGLRVGRELRIAVGTVVAGVGIQGEGQGRSNMMMGTYSPCCVMVLWQPPDLDTDTCVCGTLSYHCGLQSVGRPALGGLVI